MTLSYRFHTVYACCKLYSVNILWNALTNCTIMKRDSGKQVILSGAISATLWCS